LEQGRTTECIAPIAQLDRASVYGTEGKNSQIPQNKTVAETSKTDLASYLAQIAQKHPDLAEIVKVWPELPEHIKQAIKTLVEAHKGKG
jgi:hypothetical protein